MAHESRFDLPWFELPWFNLSLEIFHNTSARRHDNHVTQ